MSTVQRLRNELLTSRNPAQHVFWITRDEEREIIGYLADLSLIRGPRIEHLVGMFGCPVQVVG